MTTHLSTSTLQPTPRIQEKLRKLKRQEAEEEDGNNDNDGDTPMSKKKLKGDRLSKNQKVWVDVLCTMKCE